MKPICRAALLSAFFLGLSACEMLPSRTGEQPAGPASQPPMLPFEEPAAGPAELDAELVYSYLVGEVAAQRGELALAYRHYLHVATLARDPYAAERATRIAVYLGDLDAGLQAARRWVELAPNGQDARMSLALLLEHAGDRPGALAQLDALLQISSALGQDGFLQTGRVLAKEGGAQSLALMRELVAAHPNEPSAYYALAVVAISAKELVEAESALDTALGLKGDWVEAQVLLARVRSTRGEKEAAVAGLTQALKSRPDSQPLRTARARLLVDLGEHEAALKDFRRLLKQNPDDADYLYGVGMLAMHGQHWNEARRAWQKLRNQGGDRFDEATYFLGQVEENQDRLEAAAGLYASISEGELLMDAGLRLAALEARQGDLVAARTRLAELRLLVPERAVDAYLTEARLLRQAGQGDEATRLLDQAVDAEPNNIELRYGRAMHAARADDVATLETHLKYILSLEPDHVDALNALGYTLADRTDRYAEAFEYISKAHRLQPDNAAILDSLGWVYYRLGDYDLALKYLRRALEMQPDHEIAAHLGEVLWVTGDRDGARRVWREALKAAPDSEILRDVMQRFE